VPDVAIVDQMTNTDNSPKPRLFFMLFLADDEAARLADAMQPALHQTALAKRFESAPS